MIGNEMTNEERSADLDRRELKWFEWHRGWKPPVNADIAKWLGDMREEDDRLEGLGDPSKQCPECKGDYCTACR